MPAAPAAPAPPGLRSEQAYAELKTRLLVGEFPLHRRLVEEKLAGLVGVSRTPVREALARLHAEGLIARAADGGFTPTVPDVTLVQDLYEVRAGLELQALRRPATLGQKHDIEQLEALRDEWRTMSGDSEAGEADPGFVLLDESFHVTLAESAGNPALAEVLQQVNERIRVVRMQDFMSPERIERTVDEHLSIVDAVLAGRLVEAESQFTSHLDTSRAVVERRVSRAISRMARGSGE
ncbi:MAG: GntR family transcriptional regulator [Actinobacteria bacterium]|nr:GntR family transcriptional regulator [Actinomycetota bacterium]